MAINQLANAAMSGVANSLGIGAQQSTGSITFGNQLMPPPADPYWSLTNTAGWPTPPVPHPAITANECGRVRIEKLENGYVVVFMKNFHGQEERYFAADAKEVGERITACMVREMLAGDPRKDAEANQAR